MRRCIAALFWTIAVILWLCRWFIQCLIIEKWYNWLVFQANFRLVPLVIQNTTIFDLGNLFFHLLGKMLSRLFLEGTLARCRSWGMAKLCIGLMKTFWTVFGKISWKRGYADFCPFWKIRVLKLWSWNYISGNWAEGGIGRSEEVLSRENRFTAWFSNKKFFGLFHYIGIFSNSTQITLTSWSCLICW